MWAIVKMMKYNIYISRESGDVIDYGGPVATVADERWTSGPLTAPGRYRLAVRAMDDLTGLEERNIDAVVELRLDAAGNDVTAVPRPPVGLRAFPRAGGVIRVEWTSPCPDPRTRPLGFNVYAQPTGGTGGPTLAMSVPWEQGRLGWFSADLAGLDLSLSHAISVKASNAVGEEANDRTVIVPAAGVPPGLVDALAAVATSQEA